MPLAHPFSLVILQQATQLEVQPHSSLLLFPFAWAPFQLTAVLHAGSWITCQSFLNPRLCFSRLSRPGRQLLRPESVILPVDNLYAEAIEAVKSWVALSVSSPVNLDSQWNPKARLWNTSKSVNLSTGSERFLVLTWS
jgi:hypothetical protein